MTKCVSYTVRGLMQEVCLETGWAYPCQSHMWLSEQVLCTEGEASTSVTAAHQKVPKRGWRSLGGPPKSAPCHLCASLTFCLSYTNVFSPRLPSPAHPLLLLPFFFRRQEKWHLLMANLCAWLPRKPELRLDHSWRLSINSSNHQSAKFFSFRAHQLRMRWLGVIYKVKNISRFCRFTLVCIWCNIFMIRSVRDRRIHPAKRCLKCFYLTFFPPIQLKQNKNVRLKYYFWDRFHFIYI